MTQRVLVTRPAHQSGALMRALRAVGIQPVSVPAVAVEIDRAGGSLDDAVKELHTYDWVVVTSANGARAALTAAQRVSALLEGPSWAAVGPATAGVLRRAGIAVDVEPTQPDSATLARELPIAPRRRVLLLRGNLADDALPRHLRERGAHVTDVVAYRAIEAPSASGALLRDAFAGGPLTGVVFASPSAARGLSVLAAAENLDVTSLRAICIGQTTAREAELLGYPVVATSPTPDPEALAATAAVAFAQLAGLR